MAGSTQSPKDLRKTSKRRIIPLKLDYCLVYYYDIGLLYQINVLYNSPIVV